MTSKIKPVRSRQAMTVTLSPSGVGTLEGYARKHDGNRSKALDAVLGRYGYLLTTADLSGLQYDDFERLCWLRDGIGPSSDVSAKQALRIAVFSRLAALEDLETDLATMTFADDRKSHDKAINDIAAEKEYMKELTGTLARFSELQSMVILEALEEFQAATDRDQPSATCKAIYEKLRSPRSRMALWS